jgi:molybdenum cofactor guanylyltransferase
MGRDKGLIRSAAGESWVGLAIKKMAFLKIPVSISINADQTAVYKHDFPEIQLIPDDSDLTVGGPLLGLLSAHRKAPADDLIVLACDLPQMEPGLLTDLQECRDSIDADVYLYAMNHEWEPLCGIYTAAALRKIMLLYNGGQLERHSMKYVLGQLQVKVLDIPKDKIGCFANINAPSDLNDEV